MQCEGCKKRENLFMCFFTDKKKEVYLCAACLGKLLLEEPSNIKVYSINKIGYTWKTPQIAQNKSN